MAVPKVDPATEIVTVFPASAVPESEKVEAVAEFIKLLGVSSETVVIVSLAKVCWAVAVLPAASVIAAFTVIGPSAKELISMSKERLALCSCRNFVCLQDVDNFYKNLHLFYDDCNFPRVRFF